MVINKNWYPNWDLDVTYYWIESSDGSFNSMLDVALFEEAPGKFRIYSDPLCDELYWGDLLEADQSDDDDQTIVCTGVIERVVEKLTNSLLSKNDSKDLQNKPLLKSIIENGGYWEINFGGYLNIYKHL